MKLKLTWETTCEEVYRRDAIVSIRLREQVFSGGAHHNVDILTLNYLGETHGRLVIHDIFGRDDARIEAAFALFKEKVFEFYGGEVRKHFTSYQRHYSPELMWDLLSQFNVEQDGLRFNVSPYGILPWSYGATSVALPWGAVSSLLGPFGRQLRDAVASPS